MKKKARRMGIDVIDAVPWGTHICQFYDTKQDLVDILIPYFKAGLENNELCIWVTSEPLSEKEAEEAMRKAMPNLAQYLERRQIEIVPHTEWYVKDGAFNSQRVLNAWIHKLDQALGEGYEGIRVTGDTSWLERKDWRNWASYEEMLNNDIGNYQMIAICTYSLGRSAGSEVLDVMDNHQLALIRRAGAWELSKPTVGRQMTLGAMSARTRRLVSLQKRFIQSGFEDFSDRGIIELLLSLALPYWESQKLAKECLAEFKDLTGFLGASTRELERVGVTRHALLCMKVLRELPTEILRKKVIEQPFYKSPKEVFDYLYYSMRGLKQEVLKAIYLNSRNEITDMVTLFEGTLESIPIRPREIVESAIKYGCTAVIFVHNHPSGDPAPSKSDKRFTRDLVFVGDIIQIKVLDHMIIGGNSYFSFADEGLIKKYQLDLLNLKMHALSDSGVKLL
ncbi:MAG: DNA repair protein RadC [Dehalococcoidales bacterium]|nr:DNA repair protein RadC [Dehalococcoidales bacterium]